MDYNCLAALDKRILCLHYLRGWSVEKIAASYSIEPTTAGKLLADAKRKVSVVTLAEADTHNE